MDIYNYNNVTGEFITKTPANVNPLVANEFLIPANATTINPPIVNTNEVAIFNKDTSAWYVVKDFRGTVYWTDANTKHTISNINETVPSAATTEAPLSKEYTLNNGAWRAKTVEEYDVEKEAQVERELGTDTIRILIDTFVEVNVINKTTEEILTIAKAKRRLEL